MHRQIDVVVVLLRVLLTLVQHLELLLEERLLVPRAGDTLVARVGHQLLALVPWVRGCSTHAKHGNPVRIAPGALPRWHRAAVGRKGTALIPKLPGTASSLESWDDARIFFMY